MKAIFQIATLALSISPLLGPLQAQRNASGNKQPAVKCTSEESPYRDFDFIVGTWEYRTLDGHKVADQVITSQGEGCAIVEEWNEVSGITGRGISFVDPATGRWRQVWMSSRFHIDYSGGLDANGAMVLEGTMYPTNGSASSRIRGVWTKQADGSIRKEFFGFDEQSHQWVSFFAGIAYPK